MLLRRNGGRSMGAKSQRKGRAAELELSHILQGHGYSVEPGRALAYGDVPDLTGLPAVFHRRNREPWRVTMELPDWLELYRSYQPPRDSNHGG